MLDEVVITQAIIENYKKELMDAVVSDVVIVGGGPSGLMAGYFLAKKGVKTVLFEKRLSIGGGMWGGGMMFNKIVVQHEGKRILNLLGVKIKKFKEGYYISDAIETICALGYKAKQAGLKIFNLISVEDLVVRENRIEGVVLNWSAVEKAGLHIDPLGVKSNMVIDATGHNAEVINIFKKKIRKPLNIPSDIEGEKSMWAHLGEKEVVQNSKEVYPGLWVCGMAANAVFGSYRMGPVFGGMLLSGKKVAKIIIQRMKKI